MEPTPSIAAAAVEGAAASEERMRCVSTLLSFESPRATADEQHAFASCVDWLRPFTPSGFEVGFVQASAVLVLLAFVAGVAFGFPAGGRVERRIAGALLFPSAVFCGLLALALVLRAVVYLAG